VELMLSFPNPSELELTNLILSSFGNHPSTVRAVVLLVVFDLLGLSVEK
jgi:hypothetical protein